MAAELLKNVLETGRTIERGINEWYEVPEKTERLDDRLGRLSDDQENWETQITKFGRSEDKELRQVIRKAQATLDKEMVKLFGTYDRRSRWCVSKYTRAIRYWLFPSLFEPRIKKVSNIGGEGDYSCQCVSKYKRKFKFWLFPSMLEWSIQNVTSVCEDLDHCLTTGNQKKVSGETATTGKTPTKERTASKERTATKGRKLTEGREEIEGRKSIGREEIKGRKSTESPSRERAVWGPSKFSFGTRSCYIPLQKTEESVRKALRNSKGPSLILLHGGPGTGKSSLAKNVALHFQKQASTVNRVFEQVVYVECGPEVTLAAKQRELVDHLDAFARSSEASDFNPNQKSRVNTGTTNLLSGLLKGRSLLIILDDVWESECDSSTSPSTSASQSSSSSQSSSASQSNTGSQSNFLQAMVGHSAQRVKWLVTSRSQHVCDHVHIGSRSIGMEKIEQVNARQILAALTGMNKSYIRDMKDVMDPIITDTDANLLGMTCVAVGMKYEKNKQKKEWTRLSKSLAVTLRSEAKEQGRSHDLSRWGAIRFGFQRLSPAQKNLLILIQMCKSSSISSAVIQYLFDRTKYPNCSESFSKARDELHKRQLLTIKTVTYKILPEEESWSIHGQLRGFIKEEVFGDLDDGVSVIETLAQRSEGIMFNTGPTTELESDVVTSMGSSYFGDYFRREFAEKMGLLQYTPQTTDLRRNVIDPVAKLLVRTEDEQWTSMLHSSVQQVFLKYVKDGTFDEVSTSNLLNSPVSKIPMLRALYRSAFSDNHPILGQQIISALLSLLEDQIVLVVGAIPNYASAGDCGLLLWTSYAVAVSLSKINQENMTVSHYSGCFQTVLEKLTAGLARVDNRSGSPPLDKLPHISDQISPNDDAKVNCASAVANLGCGGEDIAGKMIEFPELLHNLVAAMEKTDCPDLQEQVARAISNLATNPTDTTGSKIVSSPKVLHALVTGLESRKSQEVQENSAWALANLSEGNDEIRREIISFEGMLRTLVFAMAEVDNHNVNQQSARALANLACGGHDIKVKMIDSPRLPAKLLTAMGRDDSPGLQKQAARGIANLGANGIMSNIGNSSEVLHALVAGLEVCKSQKAQEWSAWVLANLASSNDEIRCRILEIDGALKWLVFGLAESDNHDVNEDCARALANLSGGGSDIQAKMINFPDLLPNLVKAMGKNDCPGLQKQAVRAVVYLAADGTSTAVSKIVDRPGVLDSLIAGLGDWNSQELQEHSAWALANLACGNDEIKGNLLKYEGALQKLVFAMVEVANHHVNEECARALANLALGGYEKKIKMINFPKLLDNLVKAMGNYGCSEVQEEAARAIANLSTNGKGGRHGAGSKILGSRITDCPGVLAALVKGLQNCKCQEVQNWSARALANLAHVNDQTRWKIITVEGSLRKLVFAMVESENLDVNEQSARAIANLALGDRSIIDKMIESLELLQGLAKCIRQYDCPHLQSLAAEAVVNFSVNGTNDAASKIAHCPGVLEALVAGLRNCKAQKWCAWALANLADLNDEIRGKVIAVDGALRKLMSGMVDADNGDVNLQCAWALANLASGGPDIKVKMMDFPGLLANLVTVMGRDDCPTLQERGSRAIQSLAGGRHDTRIKMTDVKHRDRKEPK